MTNSNNLIDKSSQRFQNLALLTIATIFLLILAGGIVRSTGSGMGCPDWPKCFGRWIPPTSISQLPLNYQEVYGAKLKGEVEFNAVKTWIEYVNRLLGAFSGLLVIATFVASLSYLRKDRSVFWGSLLSLLLIGMNGWLGSRVVATELAQYMITLHLLLAVLVIFALLFVVVRSGALSQPFFIQDQRKDVLNKLLIVTMVLSMGQIVLGTQVRDALNEIIQRLGYEQRDSWIAGMDWRFYVHRSFSLIILALHLALLHSLRKSAKTGMIRKLTLALAVLVLAEIATGAVMAYFAVPAAAQPVHLFLAVVMVGLQFVIWLLMHPALSLTKHASTTAHLQESII